MGADVSTGDGKPEAGASGVSAARVLEAGEGGEYLFEVLLRDALAIVINVRVEGLFRCFQVNAGTRNPAGLNGTATPSAYVTYVHGDVADADHAVCGIRALDRQAVRRLEPRDTGLWPGRSTLGGDQYAGNCFSVLKDLNGYKT